MDRHVACHREAGGACRADQGDASRRGNLGEMQACARSPGQFERCGHGHRFCTDRDAGQAEPCGDLPGVRDPPAREGMILRVQHDGVVERRCILHGVEQQLRVAKRLLAVRKSDAADLGEPGQFGQFFSSQPLG